ncbi:glycoside hydrolase family 6 protein [Rhizoctonia solani]|uniref:Glucanase n=1 Tax=Rhizoctonia solani TaxID=456999 RepID=A0A8H8SYM7_9AGAM|nr:glycoside hydrolase family 6 protein [Rhizoctonia solani]QRW22644.1 glycoside hydrolase family 6 protein [Rhizoctonia solani]
MKVSSIVAATAATFIAGVSSTPLAPRQTDVNPFAGKTFYKSPHFRASVEAEITRLNADGKTELAAKAAKVAEVPVFIWISDTAAVSTISGYLKDAAAIQKSTGKKQIVQLVVYNLPDRDCSAKASDGEFHLDNAGEARYEAYIKAVASQLQRYPEVSVAVSLEPDSIGNCDGDESFGSQVRECSTSTQTPPWIGDIVIATPNVSLYLDGAHAGWLGWPDNLAPTASVLAEILNNAKARNPKSTVRGLVTNVSNYNGLGNQEQQGRDELKYINDLAPLLTAAGYPAHFLVDQGRSGNQEAARDGGDWCNFKYAGFGPRPSATTPSSLIDAIVWVKPGGESDGTSDPASPRYDTTCTSATSYIPSPEAGNWHSAIFELLIEQANPAF